MTRRRPTRCGRADLHALTLCAGCLVTDRMLVAVSGCTEATVAAAIFFLRLDGHGIHRVAGLGYRLVLPA